ncbi:MAG: HepT-like ribonuclease domain-containing protein [Bacteroidales bacterium]
MNRILKKEANIKISSSRSIVDLRNYLAHGYDSVDYSTLWGIISKHLPVLNQEIDELLNKPI